MRIDLTCPVEVWNCHMPTAEYPFCTLKMYNLSKKDVASLQVSIRAFREGGDLLSRHVERVLAPEAEGQHVFELSVSNGDAVEAEDLEILIEKVWYADGTVWRRGVSEMTEYVPEKQLEGQQLEVLQGLAGPDASYLPSDQGNVWVCVCGRPNASGEEACARCGRDKHDVFTKLNRAELEKIILKKQNEEEEAERLQREKERLEEEEKAEVRRKKKRRRRIVRNVVLTVLLAAVAFCAVWFYGIPYYKYLKASQALENGQYAQAKEQFLALENYSDAAVMAQECDYQSAMSGLRSGTYTSLRLAQEGFDSLGDYKDSALRAMETRYTLGEKYMANSEWEKAIAMYEAVSGYEDADQKRTQAVYAWATDLFRSGDYAAAREKYLSVSGYQDAETQAKECLYQSAVHLLEGGSPLEAVEVFSDRELEGYRDAERKVLECWYTAAEGFFAQGDYDTAADYYLLAGDYSDALRKARQCLYDPAVTAMEAGDYLSAAEMLEKILTYDDAQEKWEECVMALGQAAMAAGDWSAAADWFSRLVPGNVQAETLLNESVYRQAREAMENGENDKARALFAEIPGYQDADEYRDELLYGKAVALVEEENYTEAEPILAELGDYEDSEKTLLETRYQLALSCLDRSDYAQAIYYLDQLGDYEDAQEQLTRARYLLALDLKNDGEYQKAADILYVIRDYNDAEELYAQCMYDLGVTALDSGDTDAAAEYLSAIFDFRDARDLYNRTIYADAVLRRTEGDYAAAAALFGRIRDYEDSAQQADECQDMYYASAYKEATEAYEAGEYQRAADLLKDMDLSLLPERYADLKDIFNDSAYQAAEALYAAKKPYEALVYYRMIPDYRDVASRKLTRTCYMMIGVWELEGKVKMEFREDGTCVIDGKESFFFADQYGVYLGETPERAQMEYAYNIYRCTDKVLNLMQEKGKVLYRMTRAVSPAGTGEEAE